MQTDIKFRLTVIIDNLKSGELSEISKTITRKGIVVEADIPKEIDQKNIANYFSRDIKRYCEKQNVSLEDVVIDGYEVKSKTKNIDVYFKSEDIDSFSMEPRIIARSLDVKEKPVLMCEQIDNNTVKWFWSFSEKAHYLTDAKDNVIAHTPLGVDYYIESGLKPGETYRRFLTAYDANELSLKSSECSITLIEDKKVSIYKKFEVEKRREDIITLNTEYSSRLRAFQSGVGDGNDCKIFKPDDTSYAKRFKLINKIYGVRASREIKHHTIKFGYRFKMVGTVDHMTYNSSLKVKVTATEIVKLEDEPNSNPIGSPVNCEREILYVFDDNCQVADINLYSILPEIQNNYGKRFKFDVMITDIKGKVRLFTYTHGYIDLQESDGTFTFSEKGYYDHRISIKAFPVIVQREYSEIYPPKKFEPLIGAVNGDFEVSEDGLRNMTATAPIFEASTSVYNRKYYCIIESINPKEAYVTYKFMNQVDGESYTLLNGDTIVFSSNAVLEDKTEFRDFIAQVEQGEYVITDNRRHKYRYMLEGLSVNEDQYKRFEVDIVPSTNDIVILGHTKLLTVKDGMIDTDTHVSVRAIQNAIAKWNPLIHNGYYYYNQDEYYLYSKCTSNGEGMILENVFYKPTVSVKVTVDALEPAGPIENYQIHKRTREQLLLDESLYEFVDGMIWPKPVNIPNDYYMDFLEEYNYITSPFIFDKKPTEITAIRWEQICKAPNKIDVYIIPYNDVYGEWDEPVKVNFGGPVPENLKMSQTMVMKFVMKPSRRPDLRKRLLDISCEAEWFKAADTFLSTNIYFREEIAVPKSHLSDGIVISKIMDFGDTSEKVKARAISPNMKFKGDVEFYIQEADTKEELEYKLNNSTWIKIDNKTNRGNIKRFVRFKVVIKKNSVLLNMALNVARYEYTDMQKDEYLPAFGKIRIDATYNPGETAKRYEHIIAHSLEFDGEDHVLIDDVNEYLGNFANAQGFSKDRITDYSFMPYGSQQNEVSLKYTKHIPLTDSLVYIKSNVVIHDYDAIENNQAGVLFPVQYNKVIVSPIPQQYSPVIIYKDGENEPLTNVFFEDEDGGYTLNTFEEFESLGFKTLYLKHIGIDETSIKVEINGQPVTNYCIINNVIEFEEPIESGHIIKVSYELIDSYCVNYDYENDQAIIELKGRGWENLGFVRVFLETNKSEATRKLNDICLNPIYNVAYNGYLYICDYQLDVHKIEIFPEDDYVFANGKDQLNVLIIATDKFGNPVENVDINVASALGSIEKLHDKTDINGIIKCKYTSWTGDCEDIVKAIANKNAKAEAKIINRKI